MYTPDFFLLGLWSCTGTSTSLGYLLQVVSLNSVKKMEMFMFKWKGSMLIVLRNQNNVPGCTRLCNTWFLIPMSLNKWTSMQMRLSSSCWYSIELSELAGEWMVWLPKSYFSFRLIIQSSIDIQLLTLKLIFDHVHSLMEDQCVKCSCIHCLPVRAIYSTLTLAFWDLILRLAVFKNLLTLHLCKDQLCMTFGRKCRRTDHWQLIILSHSGKLNCENICNSCPCFPVRSSSQCEPEQRLLVPYAKGSRRLLLLTCEEGMAN